MDNIISEIHGIILDFTETHVRVKLYGNDNYTNVRSHGDIIVNFPRELFSINIEEGLPIGYQIKMRPDGTKYQVFIARPPEGNPETQAELEEILKEF